MLREIQCEDSWVMSNICSEGYLRKQQCNPSSIISLRLCVCVLCVCTFLALSSAVFTSHRSAVVHMLFIHRVCNYLHYHITFIPLYDFLQEYARPHPPIHPFRIDGFLHTFPSLYKAKSLSLEMSNGNWKIFYG